MTDIVVRVAERAITVVRQVVQGPQGAPGSYIIGDGLELVSGATLTIKEDGVTLATSSNGIKVNVAGTGYVKYNGANLAAVTTIPYSDLTGVEAAGAAAASMAAHLVSVDPHPQYLTVLEGNAAYQPLNPTLTALSALLISVYGSGFLTLASAADGRTYLGLGGMATQNPANVSISGGTINGASIGAVTPASGVFTNLTATTNIRLRDNVKDGLFVASVGVGTGIYSSSLNAAESDYTPWYIDASTLYLRVRNGPGGVTVAGQLDFANGAVFALGINNTAIGSITRSTGAFSSLFVGTNAGYLGSIAAITNTPVVTSGTNCTATVYRSESPASNSTSSGLGLWVESVFTPTGTITGLSTCAVYGRVRSEGAGTGTLTTASSFASEFIQSAGNRTVSTVYGYQAAASTVSAGTVSTYVGFVAAAQASANITTAMSFRGLIASGTNRWNLYMDGTAPNYLAGATYMGAAASAGTVTGAILRANGQVQFDGTRSADAQYTLWLGKVSEGGAITFARGSDGQFTGVVGYNSRATATDFLIFSGGGSGVIQLTTGGGGVTATIGSTMRFTVTSSFAQIVNPLYVDAGSPQLRVRYFNSPTYGDILRVSALPTGSGAIVDVTNSGESAYAPIQITASSIAMAIDGTVMFSIDATSGTFSKSISGGTLTFSIQNTSNTANAFTRHQIYAAGSTAADAVINMGVTGLQDYYIGVDNSDSDALVLGRGFTPGASNAIRIPTSGAVEFPANIAVGVYTATGDVAINGYITIKDLAGTDRKLATVA